jgi:preprotein translocase subunit SecG
MVLHTLLMVVFVLVAIAMVVLILLQRGAGAQAGSGFGAGASGTVFGSRGSANFLSSSTKWLAAVFFSLSLFMAWQSAHQAKGPAVEANAVAAKTDLGIMNDLPADAGKTSAAPVPAAPVQALPAPAPANSTPAVQEPVIAPATQPAAPVEDAQPAGKGG